ncbi:MAG: glucose-1-phosphate adenylyltransferase, partial [Candidatus Pacebacteria bacterium]|nr:glucose-1-phosphate adenylyltransferase [Candidatus Paceibacterota bacterium]
GGQGTRLYPLTRDRAKPGVPFGGKYRIVDFPLANAMNSGYRKIFVMLQYASRSLHHHIQRNWNPQTGRGEFVEGLFPKMRVANELVYDGTADALWQNWKDLTDESPHVIVVLNGDHVFKMDIRQTVAFHNENNADFTICATRVSVDVARGQLGVLAVDEEYRVVAFQEKPEHPTEIPGDPGHCLASMGNYVIPVDVGADILERDATNPESGHDFGKDIIPSLIETHRVFAYPYESNQIDGEARPEWSDVGTIRAFFDACMDLCDPLPKVNLYNTRWPIPSGAEDDTAPAKFVPSRLVVSGSCIINNAKLWFCILHKYVRVEDWADLDHCVIMDHSVIGYGVRMRNTIVDKHVNVPDWTVVGFDLEQDKARGFTIEQFDGSWIVVIPGGYVFSK